MVPGYLCAGTKSSWLHAATPCAHASMQRTGNPSPLCHPCTAMPLAQAAEERGNGLMAALMTMPAPDGTPSRGEPHLLTDMQRRFRLDGEVVGALQSVRAHACVRACAPARVCVCVSVCACAHLCFLPLAQASLLCPPLPPPTHLTPLLLLNAGGV